MTLNKLGPYELNSIITGDARELAEAIPDESVDLIFTDPVYDRIDDYRWLAETAARVLKAEGLLLVWAGISRINKIMSVCNCLNYKWMLIWHRHSLRIWPGASNTITIQEPCFWFDKGKSHAYKKITDLCSTGNTKNDDYGHIWSKPVKVVSHWVSAFTHPNDIVFDPFTGGGTVPAVCKMLGRNYLAFEIDPATADAARERVLLTQPPLFVMEQPEQLELLA